MIHQLALDPMQHAQQQPIESIAFSHDNRLLAYTRAVANKTTVFIYDLYAKKLQAEIALPHHRYTHGQINRRIQFSRNRQHFLMVFNGKVSLLDMKTTAVKDFPLRSADAVFSSNDQTIIAKSRVPHSPLSLINVKTGAMRTLAIPAAANGSSLSLRQSADKRLIVIPFSTNGAKATFLILNGQTGVIVRTVEALSQ